jgi:tetratricopeptide (TPR) repeat protein
MTDNEGPKSRISVLFIAAVISVFVLGAASGYYFKRFSVVSTQYQSAQSEFERMKNENKALKESAEKAIAEGAKLSKELKEVSQDRDNAVNQLNALAGEKRRAKELDLALEDTRKKLDIFTKDKQELIDQNLLLKEQVKDLILVQKQLLKEKEDLLQAIEAERSKSFVRKLEGEKIALQKENSDLKSKLNISQADYGKSQQVLIKAQGELEKVSKESREWMERVEKLTKDYAEAVKKNRALEAKLEAMPGKYAEIARQNKTLIRRTSNMHYNMGVFYTKQKEYTRAIAEFEKAVELAPDDAYAHFNLGYIYAEYLIDRPKAVEHFRHYLRLAKKEDKDVDWAKKYIITWDAMQGDKPMD